MTQEKKKDVKELINKIWPNMKKELEKRITDSKKILEKGEEYVKEASKGGIEQVKKATLRIKREKLYYELGKLVSGTAKNKWATHKKIQELVREIRAINRKVK